MSEAAEVVENQKELNPPLEENENVEIVENENQPVQEEVKKEEIIEPIKESVEPTEENVEFTEKKDESTEERIESTEEKVESTEEKSESTKDKDESTEKNDEPNEKGNEQQSNNGSMHKLEPKSKAGSVQGSKDENMNERKSLWNIDQLIQQEIDTNEQEKKINDDKNKKTIDIIDELDSQPEEINYEEIAFADSDMTFNDSNELSNDIDASDVPTCELNKLDVYKTACKIIDVIPISYYADNMNNEELIMRNHGLGPKGAKAISESLNKTQIKILDLSGNWIDSGGKFLAQTICNNCFLTELNLSNNHLGIKGGEPMGFMIAQNTNLKILNLSRNNLSNREIKAISEGLKENDVLVSLDLSYNKINDIGALYLGKSLIENESIKVLNLGWNEIRMKGIAAFFQCLKSNQGITDLSINNNGAADIGGAAIVQYIDSNRVITRLNLKSCRLPDSIAGPLFKALEQNNGLVEIILDSNCFTDAFFPSLNNFCQKITSPRTIHLEDIKLSEDINKKLEQLKEEKAEFTFYL
ncbi:hypothetical protein H8356DRAFT_1727909 [Neocallimastix lanati (nom. inval.)]|jgi:hypothetical protein|nr:hypothetical protein H8356DRAFT_1727909 [Neocallimastix sp. JGI-2020a]